MLSFQQQVSASFCTEVSFLPDRIPQDKHLWIPVVQLVSNQTLNCPIEGIPSYEDLRGSPLSSFQALSTLLNQATQGRDNTSR